MNIQLRQSKINLTSEDKEYISQKINMLKKYLGNVPVLSCNVEVGLDSNHHQKGKIYFTKVNLKLKGELLRVEKHEESLKKSIDKVKDHLAQSITKYKDKKRTS